MSERPTGMTHNAKERLLVLEEVQRQVTQANRSFIVDEAFLLDPVMRHQDQLAALDRIARAVEYARDELESMWSKGRGA